MKIYFCGSIRAGRQDVHLYGQLVQLLAKRGEILTPFVADPKVTALGTDEGTATTDREIYDRDVQLLGECDVLVAECTIPSHGVGYEIGHAIAIGGKRILCIYRPQEGKKLSAMLSGIPQDKASVEAYENVEAAESIFKSFFGE